MPRGANRPVRQRKVVTHYTDDNPSTFTVKPRRGETLPTVSEAGTSTAPITSRKRKAPCQKPLPQADTIIAHRTRVQPILPLVEFLPHPPPTTHPSLHPGVPTSHFPPPPTWTTYGPSSSSIDTTITWLSVRVDDPRYAVAGDVSGTLWLLDHRAGRPLRTIRCSSAAQRPPHRRMNAILQAAWSHNRILVWTRSEVEGIDVSDDVEDTDEDDDDDSKNGRVLFTQPVSAAEEKRIGSAPLLAVRQQDFLWCTTAGQILTGCWDDTLTALDLEMERCGSVLWEVQEPQLHDTFLCVVSTASDGVELWRCRKEQRPPDASTTPTTVLLRRPLPSTRHADCAIQQYDNAYTFVCGRGVRMYQSNDLVLLTTMGESVQLHGQLTLWSRCCWLPRPAVRGRSDITIRNEKRSYWLEHTDALAEKSTLEDDNNNDLATTEYWLMGIPHPRKGPLELQTTLYFLSPDGATATTRDGPPKGCVGDVWVDRDRWSVVALSAEKGRLVQLAPSMESDFPGVMYPVGFQEITSNNIEYIEDEDELDEHVFLHEEKEQVEDVDMELAEAMRQSLLEQQEQAKEDPVIDPILEVLRPKSDVVDDMLQVGAWPEISRSDSGDASTVPGSPQRDHSASSLLLPHHMAQVRTAVELQQDERQAAEDPDAKPKPGPMKKRVTIEALLQLSLDQNLRRRMAHLRGAWIDNAATGSISVALPPLTSLDEAAATIATPLCPACRGRSVVHSCGQREMPVDHDAIARADRERHEQEQAEKHRKRLEKRKQAEAKRKEAKRLRRLEEEAEARRKYEEEEQQRIHLAEQQALARQHTAPTAPIVPQSAVPPSPYAASAYHNGGNQVHSETYASAATPQSPYFGSTFRINGNEVQPSTSLHPTDALAALAGLADSFSQPIPTTPAPAETMATTASSPLNLLSSASVQVSEDVAESSPPPPPSFEQPAAATTAAASTSTGEPANEQSEKTSSSATTDASQMALSALVMLCGAADPMQTTDKQAVPTPELSKDKDPADDATFVDNAAKGNGSNDNNSSNNNVSTTKVEG